MGSHLHESQFLLTVLNYWYDIIDTISLRLLTDIVSYVDGIP